MIDILSIIAEDKNLITYRPSLRKICNSVTSTILLQQILYWWIKNGKKPFYKFKEPCMHHNYNDGDSWCEELAFSKKEFDSSLKRIAIKLNSKSKQTDHQMFVEYWSTQDRKTFYQINEENLGKVLKGIYLSDERGFRKSTKGDLDIQYTETTTETTTIHQNKFDDEFNFEKFWNLYNKKVERKKCERKFNKLSFEIRKKIFQHIPKYFKSIEGTFQNKKHPATYLNGECWNDEIQSNTQQSTPKRASNSILNKRPNYE